MDSVEKPVIKRSSIPNLDEEDAESSLQTLPNFKKAIIDERKFTHYALDPTNKNGGAEKAILFKSALGFTKEDSGELIRQIRTRLGDTDAVYKGAGYKGLGSYEVSVMIHGKHSKNAPVMTGWKIKDGVPRLISPYADTKRQHRMKRGE